MTKKTRNQKERSETGDVLRVINYIFILIASIYMFIFRKDAFAFMFIIIWLINALFVSLYTKEVKLRRNNTITLKKNKKLFITYQIIMVIGIFILIIFELKLMI